MPNSSPHDSVRQHTATHVASLPEWLPARLPACLITCLSLLQLDDVWQSAASVMRAKLLKALGPEQCSELHIIGRSRKQKVMLDAEHVLERMEVAGKTYEYMQVRSLC